MRKTPSSKLNQKLLIDACSSVMDKFLKSRVIGLMLARNLIKSTHIAILFLTFLVFNNKSNQTNSVESCYFAVVVK